MPATSEKQARLFRAADHGWQTPIAKKLRGSTTHQQRRDFSHTAGKSAKRTSGRK